MNQLGNMGGPESIIGNVLMANVIVGVLLLLCGCYYPDDAVCTITHDDHF